MVLPATCQSTRCSHNCLSQAVQDLWPPGFDTHCLHKDECRHNKVNFSCSYTLPSSFRLIKILLKTIITLFFEYDNFFIF